LLLLLLLLARQDFQYFDGMQSRSLQFVQEPSRNSCHTAWQ
jgi:hypothetical protein